MHSVGGAESSLREDLTHGTINHHVAVHLLSFEPLILECNSDCEGCHSATQGFCGNRDADSKSYTFEEMPSRLDALLQEARPHHMAFVSLYHVTRAAFNIPSLF